MHIIANYVLATSLHIRVTSEFYPDTAYGLEIISASWNKLRLIFIDKRHLSLSTALLCYIQ